MREWLALWPDGDTWLGVGVAACLVVAVVLVIHLVGGSIFRRIARKRPYAEPLVSRTWRPSRWWLVLMALYGVWQVAPDSLEGIDEIRSATLVVLIAAVTWMGIAAARAIGDTVIAATPADDQDNLDARRIVTQTRVLTRTATVLIGLIGIGFALMTLPGVRRIGTSLLASAGVAGVIAGLAARPVFGNLIAGLQIAFTQPIRLDDILIVEGEWGRVEEITGTYVVLRTWDLRRIIIPLQWFIENRFQNWTRTDSALLGRVELWVDFSTPLEPLREELRRIVETRSEWNGELAVLQVIDTSERAMKLRVLASANNSGLSWDLCCAVREGLIHFMQREFPACLPQLRIEVSTGQPTGSGRQRDPAVPDNARLVDAHKPPRSSAA